MAWDSYILWERELCGSEQMKRWRQIQGLGLNRGDKMSVSYAGHNINTFLSICKKICQIMKIFLSVSGSVIYFFFSFTRKPQ